jgi:hypothetical protein
VIRDGNYDFLTNSQRWHNTPWAVRDAQFDVKPTSQN